ncbi:MAG TPA: hypothetical protein DCY14_17800 [Anaerolineae bacterium]|nr:hypothetical protein [Anaerolineae bacterium]
MYPDRTMSGTGMVFKQDGGIIPVQGHQVGEGNLWRRPADASQPGDGFPVRAGFLALCFERAWAGAEDVGGFFVRNDGAIHGTRTEGSVGVRIHVDQHTLQTTAEAHQRSAPGAGIFRGGGRIDLDQPALGNDHP